MRIKLAKYCGERIRLRATVRRFSRKSKYKNSPETIMLSDVFNAETNEKITDHIWINPRKRIGDANLDRGDIIEFNAVIREYTKKNGVKDYKVSYPSQIKKIGTDYNLQRDKKPDDIYWLYERGLASLKRAYSYAIEIGDMFEVKNIQKEINNYREEFNRRRKFIKTISCPHCNYSFTEICEESFVECRSCKGFFGVIIGD